MSRQKLYRVVLRRANGRFVKQSEPTSKYAAKKLAEYYEQTHDQSYYTEVEPVKGEQNG
jgi:hypothetical protein